MRRRSARRAILPITLSRASRWQDSSKRERASRKSPLPKSLRPQRRVAVSIKAGARTGRRGIRVFSSSAPQPLRNRTGSRERVCSRVVAEEFIRRNGLPSLWPVFRAAGYETLGQMRTRRGATVKQQNGTARDGCAPRTIVPSYPV
jgi:hypothetical protein